MAARKGSNHHKKNNSNFNSYAKLLGVGFLGCAGYYYFKHYIQNSNQQQQQPQNDDDDAPPQPLYKMTPLGDFDDTDDTNMNTTFYTTGPGDGQKMDVRQEYISTLLQQRRFSSVLCNPHLNHHKVEHYFHLGFDSSSPLLSHFNRIKWVIIVKTKADVQLVARRILNEFPQFAEEKNDNDLPKPIGSTDRFYMLRIASMVIVSCGIGAASISILLQEITKVLVDAGAFAPNENNKSLSYNTSYVEYILLISAPGIKTSPSKKMAVRRKSLDNIFDVKTSSSAQTSFLHQRSRSGSTTPRGTSKRFDLSSLKVDLKAERQRSSEIFGSSNHIFDDEDDEKRPQQITGGEVPVIIPTSCYNEKLSNYREFTTCGEIQKRQMKFDRNLISDIKIRCAFLKSLKPKMGKGLSVQYFHEALSHNSVAINQDGNIKSKFIQSCIDQNVKYVDMESGYLAAFCNTLHISCVAIVGIEYDIAAPSKPDHNMRVSHNTAIQATLDIFCQYLWDRISQDNSMKHAKSQPMDHQNDQMDVGGDYDDVEDDVNEVSEVHIAALDRSNSWNGLPTNTKSVLKPKNKIKSKGHDDSAPPAYHNNFNVNHEEGGGDNGVYPTPL